MATFQVELLICQSNLLISYVHSATTTLNDQLVLRGLKVIENIVPGKSCFFTHEIFICLSHTNLLANFFRIRNFFLGGITTEWIFIFIFFLVFSLFLRMILSVLNIKLTFSLYFSFLLINSSKICAWFHSFRNFITLLTTCELTFLNYTFFKFFCTKLTFWRQKVVFHSYVLFQILLNVTRYFPISLVAWNNTLLNFVFLQRVL